MRGLLFGLGLLAGWIASGVYLIPTHRADARAMESALAEERVKRVNKEIAADQADARIRAANVEIDRLRRQLIREREVGQGRTEFAEGQEIPPADLIPATNLEVPKK